LLLALFAVTIAAILAMSFLGSQSTAVGIARNTQDHAKARYAAESGLALAVAHLRSNATWRDDHPNGAWVTDEPFGAGTFTIVGQDGVDADGDGVIGVPAEGDGDLADDPSELATLTVTGRVNGTTHVVSAEIEPVPALGALLLVTSTADLPDDTEREQFATGKGWAVTTIKENATQAAFDTAVAAADIAYVSSTVSAAALGDQLANVSIGVVTEQPELTDEFGFSTTSATYTDDQINITDNTHEITSSFSAGLLTVATPDQPLTTATGTIDPGAVALGESTASSDPSLLTLDELSRFGDETIQATQVGQNRNKIVAAQMALPEDGTVVRITAYVKGPPPKEVRLAIYADSAGEPGALLAQCDPFIASSTWMWQSATVPATPLTAGTYWLAAHSEGNSHAWVYGGSGAIRRKDSAYGGGPPDPWGVSDDTYAGSMSIYASYSPGLGGGGGAPGRRVFMPWGGGGFAFTALTADGLELLAKALEWAGQPDGGGGGAYNYDVRWTN
jgi:hypothetical protein